MSDAGSGVAAPTATVDLDASTAGANTVTVTATDLAGNVATAPCSYRVVYEVRSVAPFFTSIARSTAGGKVTPISFTLHDANGRRVDGNVVGTPTTVAATCPTGWALPMLNASWLPSGVMNLGSGSWYVGWKPPRSQRGTCQEHRIPLDDGTTISVLAKIT